MIPRNLFVLAVANYNMLRYSEITVWREPGYKVPEDITEKGKQSFDEPRGWRYAFVSRAPGDAHEIRFASHEREPKRRRVDI